MKDVLKYCFRLLSRRDYLTSEIIDKVTKKFSYKESLAVVEKLTDLKYLDDEKVVRNYVSYKLRSGYGRYYISNKLFERGVKNISSDFIDTVAYEDGIDVLDKINSFKLKFVDKNVEDREKLYIRTLNYLKNRGYHISDIVKIVKREDFLK